MPVIQAAGVHPSYADKPAMAPSTIGMLYAGSGMTVSSCFLVFLLPDVVFLPNSCWWTARTAIQSQNRHVETSVQTRARNGPRAERSRLEKEDQVRAGQGRPTEVRPLKTAVLTA
jgi:hypothetical protein